MGQFTSIIMSDGARIEAYRAPPTTARRGGLVLLQEIFGLTDHIQEQCEKFAANGYEVLAPAIFDRVAPSLRLSYDAAGLEKAISLVRAHPFELGIADAATCVEELRHAGPVFMLGYCYGGSIAWASAGRLNGLSAAICYYGGKLPTLASEAPLCPTLVHLGRDDREIPMRSTREALEQHSAVEVLTYPAGHGFNSDRRADFDQLCSDLAFRETLRFLEKQSVVPRPVKDE
ncbi:dienelactone hydrolase family protein [Pseudochelatococcus sp. B33]